MVKSGKFPYQKAAEALSRLDFETAQIVAEDFGVTTRTLTNWKERLRTDPILQSAYGTIAAKRVEVLTTRIPKSIEKIIHFLESGTNELDPADPESIKAMISAAETLTELMIVLKRITS